MKRPSDYKCPEKSTSLLWWIWKNTIRYLLLVIMQAGSFAVAQKPNLKFGHLDINDGLSQNHVICILQDSRGFMWFGTRDGLNKYDGYKFTVYRNDAGDKHSISNNYISGIVEDNKGIIWVATRGGGLNRYDKEKNRFTHFKSNPRDSNSMSNDLVTNLSIDADGNLWLCTERGLSCFETGKNRFTHYNINASCVLEDRERRLWIGTYKDGLTLLNRKAASFKAFRHDEKNASSLSGNRVNVVFEDSKNQLWVGLIGGGLDIFDRLTGKSRRIGYEKRAGKRLSVDIVLAISEDEEGNVWIGTENGGLNVYDPRTGTIDVYMHDETDGRSISHNSVYSFYKDANNNMWVGTYTGGINIVTKKSSRFEHFKHTLDKSSLSHNNVLCMEEKEDGRIWIGTDGGGLDLFDPITRNITHYPSRKGDKNSICGNYVLSVCGDGTGNLWVGTWGDGITVFNPQLNTYRHFKHDPNDSSSISSNNAWVIFKDRASAIWIGTYAGGLNLYNPATNTFKRFNDGSGNSGSMKIVSISENSHGDLLISTDGGGLQIFNKKSGSFSSLVHQDSGNSLSDNCVNYSTEDKLGNLWINTMGGLNYYNTKKKSFKTYTTADGLANNLVFGLLEDSTGTLWLSTNKGISSFDPRLGKFKNYSLEDGLQSYEFKMRAFCKARSGAMYFGGINGFNEFYPGKVKATLFEPPLVLTSFQVFNKDVPVTTDNVRTLLKEDISQTRELTIPYESSVFSFEFASLNYTSMEKKQYAYMLEGFDKGWNEIGTDRSATYTNLDPGNYVFKVKGFDNEEEWSSRTVAIQLTIAPPFWLTWWFRLAVVLMIIASAIGFYKVRVNRINVQKTMLQQKVAEQTSQLVQSTLEEQQAREMAEQANKELGRKNLELEQFAYVASHDLQEPLRTTSSFVTLLQDQYQGKLDAKADKYLNFISDASGRMKILIRDLLEYSRIGHKKELEQVNCSVKLEEVITDLGMAIGEAGAKITSGPLPVVKGYSTEIKQLFQNLVTNAIKFRKNDTEPTIVISARNTGRDWEFSFKDNGIGIDKQHKERIFVIFQRLHTRNEYDGSGIGLAHCKKIVELHGGDIWVESEPGQGSTFCFTIPA